MLFTEESIVIASESEAIQKTSLSVDCFAFARNDGVDGPCSEASKCRKVVGDETRHIEGAAHGQD